jgi:hypothetical protein
MSVSWLSACTAAALSCSSLAGPDWVEPKGEDAGALPIDSQPTFGNGPLGAIKGNLNGVGLGPGAADLHDLYLICVEDPELFFASTVNGFGGFATDFDSRLFLFDPAGGGILGNDDTQTFQTGGVSESTLLSSSNDGSGVFVELPGLYVLGITVSPQTPESPGGPLFFLASPFEVSGPDGPGGGQEVMEWTPFVGACCFFEGGCANLTPGDCKEFGGQYQGDNTSCEVQGCPVLCPPSENNCFESAGTPGCSDAECCAAVCAVDPFCCEIAWDSICAGEAQAICGDAACDPDAGPCGVPHGTPGCSDVICCKKVCLIDPFCCDVQWDSICVQEAIDKGCVEAATCPPGANNNCFNPQDSSPGCNDVECCNAVCAVDPFCCETAWDSICAQEAQAMCGNAACGPPNPASCFVPHPTPGCNDAICCKKICLIDPFCCDVQWDSICVNEALQLCPEPLPPPPPPGGKPVTGDYRIVLQGVCFADDVAVGACLLPGGCVVTDEFSCALKKGRFLGPGTTCCPGDVNGDFVVNVTDLVAVITQWACAGSCAADVNGDGVVNVKDLIMVLTSWGPC